MPTLFSNIEQRTAYRRIADLSANELYKTFSTPQCRSCLERMADGVLLLNSDREVMFASAQVDQLNRRSRSAFSLTPKFSLFDSAHAFRFEAFISGKNADAGPLSLLLGDGKDRNMVLLTCFRLPETSVPELYAATHMITLRTPSHYAAKQWQLFTKQFALTQAETRLCHALADGLTIKDYCDSWRVTVSTARSQLRSVFAKTSTSRQFELMRLIYLFTRT